MKAFGFIIFLWGLNLWAEAPPPQKYLELKVQSPVKLMVGQKAQGIVSIKVMDGFHIQSNPASQPQLIATTLEVESKDGISAEPTIYPKGNPYRQQGATGDISVYEGKFSLKVPLTADSGARVGAKRLRAKLRYQACNEKTCFFPINSEIEIPVDVKANPKKS